MLGYIILILLQIAAAWFGEPYVTKHLPTAIGATPMLFARAAIYAIIVWIVGLVGSFVIKDVRLPSTGTVASALLGAIIGAALLVVPQVKSMLPSVHPMFLPLGGAILGYLARR